MKASKQFNLLLVLVVMLLLAACATRTPQPSSSEATTVPSKAEVATAAPTEASTHDIVITHWYHQYGEEGTFKTARRYAAEYSSKTTGINHR